MDLLTAVLHELGHVAGLADESADPAGDDLMSAQHQGQPVIACHHTARLCHQQDARSIVPG